jgi:hypothetical protein
MWGGTLALRFVTVMYVCVCVCIYSHVCMCVYIYIYMLMSMYECIYLCVYTGGVPGRGCGWCGVAVGGYGCGGVLLLFVL